MILRAEDAGATILAELIEAQIRQMTSFTGLLAYAGNLRG